MNENEKDRLRKIYFNCYREGSRQFNIYFTYENPYNEETFCYDAFSDGYLSAKKIRIEQDRDYT